MFFKRYKLLISKLIMVVMLFASLAPSVSHALVFLTGNQAFTQTICSSNGSKVVIQVKTTMGKQLATELNVAGSSIPKATDSHFEHCPYCASQQNVAFLPITNTLIIAALTAEAQIIAERSVVAVASQPHPTPPSQAPPAHSNC